MEALDPYDLVRIALPLDYEDTLRLCSVNRLYGDICGEDRFWRQKALHVYGFDLRDIATVAASTRERYRWLEKSLSVFNFTSFYDPVRNDLPYWSFRLDYTYDLPDPASVLLDAMGTERELVNRMTRLPPHSIPSVEDLFKVIVLLVQKPRAFRFGFIVTLFLNYHGQEFFKKYLLRYGTTQWFLKNRRPLSFDLLREIDLARQMYLDEPLEADEYYIAIVDALVRGRRYRDILSLLYGFDVGEETFDFVIEIMEETLTPEDINDEFRTFFAALPPEYALTSERVLALEDAIGSGDNA